MNHLIDLTDLSKNQWEEIVDLAIDIYNEPEKYSNACKGKVLATLFYEPSTRTQMSFQTAMLRLGGSLVGFDNPQNSSVSKGENMADTIRIVSNYVDAIVMRHPNEGAALAAGQYTDKVLINAGDGGHFHPTQTLLDIVTIKQEFGKLDNLVIGVCGDLKNGRTVHSLINLLTHYSNISFYLISTEELKLPDLFKEQIESSGCCYHEVVSIEECIKNIDVLYMTRIQKERFASEELYLSQKNTYILDKKKLESAKSSLVIMHPLPRVDEIAMEIDDDPRARYFKQAEYGMYARMALILTLLKEKRSKNVLKDTSCSSRCRNPNCITNYEKYLRKSFVKLGGNSYCEYCGTKL